MKSMRMRWRLTKSTSLILNLLERQRSTENIIEDYDSNTADRSTGGGC